ncbi:hypothetical protein ACW0JT_19640 [Arthrobacter sp. SA17]
MNTGDLVVADEDGVVVVPWDLREIVATATRATLKREQKLMAMVLDGLSTAEFFGLGPAPVAKETLLRPR